MRRGHQFSSNLPHHPCFVTGTISRQSLRAFESNSQNNDCKNVTPSCGTQQKLMLDGWEFATSKYIFVPKDHPLFAQKCCPTENVSLYLLQGTLMPFTNFLLLIGLHFLVVEVLCCTLDIVEAKLGVLLCFIGVVWQMPVYACPVGFAILQPGEQLGCPL